jgi:AcrR family transcriptional regulator
MATATRHGPGRPVGARTGTSVRREEYLDALVGAIRTAGPAASLGDLAIAAGMSKPVLYDHFTDRLGLTAAVAGKVIETETAAAMRAVLAGGTPRELIARTIDVFVGFVEREPLLYAWMIRGARDLPGSLADLPLALEAGNRLSAVLGSVLRDAGVDSRGAEPMALGIIGLVLSATEWWLVRRTMSRAELVEHLSGFVWGGLVSAGVDRLDLAKILAAVPALLEIGREAVDGPALDRRPE